MRLVARTFAAVALLSVSSVAVPPAHAQLMDQLKSVPGVGQGASSGGLGSLGGLAMPSVGSASTDNIAGVLQYCVKNKMVGSGGASVQNSLVNKLGGQGKENANPGFASGSKGLLDTGGGKSFDLSSMKSELTDKVCDQVLQHAKSLI